MSSLITSELRDFFDRKDAQEAAKTDYGNMTAEQLRAAAADAKAESQAYVVRAAKLLQDAEDLSVLAQGLLYRASELDAEATATATEPEQS